MPGSAQKACPGSCTYCLTASHKNIAYWFLMDLSYLAVVCSGVLFSFCRFLFARISDCSPNCSVRYSSPRRQEHSKLKCSAYRGTLVVGTPSISLATLQSVIWHVAIRYLGVLPDNQ